MIARSKPSIEVVAGVIRRDDGRVLIALRPGHLDQGGLWEFPGGKRERGETRFGTLARELKEELDIQIAGATPLLRLRHDYPDKAVDLDVWDISTWEGRAKGLEGQRIRWVPPDELRRYEFPAANKTVINAVQLPRVMLATQLPDGDAAMFLRHLEACLRTGVRTVLMRSTHSGAGTDLDLATRSSALCRKFEAKLLLTSTAANVAHVGACGLHLDGRVLSATSKRPLGRDYLVSALCVNASELAHAERIGIDMVLIAPVYEDRGFPDTAPLGWSKLEPLVRGTRLPAYAAGGLHPADLARSISVGCQGIVMDGGLWSIEPRVTLDALECALSEVRVRRGA